MAHMLHNTRHMQLQTVFFQGRGGRNSVIMCHYPMILSGCKTPWSQIRGSRHWQLSRTSNSKIAQWRQEELLIIHASVHGYNTKHAGECLSWDYELCILWKIVKESHHLLPHHQPPPSDWQHVTVNLSMPVTAPYKPALFSHDLPEALLPLHRLSPLNTHTHTLSFHLSPLHSVTSLHLSIYLSV